MTNETIAALVGAAVGAVGGGLATYLTNQVQQCAKAQSAFKIFEHLHSVWSSFSGGTIGHLQSDCPHLLESLTQATPLILQDGKPATTLNFIKYVIAFRELCAQVEQGNHGTVHHYDNGLQELYNTAKRGQPLAAQWQDL